MVVDEFHMVGEGSRGAVLEDLVTNVLFWAGASTRIVALSATIGNPDDLATFLGGGDVKNCIIYKVSRCPTNPIKEHVIVGVGAFPIHRSAEDVTGTLLFEDESALDISSSVDVLQTVSLRGEDPALLWMMHHQLALSIQRTALVKMPHRSGSVQLCFPPVTAIPQRVRRYCASLLGKGLSEVKGDSRLN